MYKNPWIGPTIWTTAGLPACVLERYTDEDESQEADTHDVGHDPVTLQGGFLGRVHEPLQRSFSSSPSLSRAR